MLCCCIFQKVKIGDLILGTIVSKTQSGMMLKVLCTTGLGASVHYVADINIKVVYFLDIIKALVK